MANIQKIFTGMSQGPETIDNNFNAINTELQNVDGVVNSLQWTKQTEGGLVASNNVQIKDGGYNYLDLNGVKLVLLSISIQITGDVKTPSVVVSLPDVITPGSMYVGTLGGQNQFQILGNQITIFDAAGSTERQLNGSNFILTKLYIA